MKDYQNQPLVSILIPLFNEENLIAQTIECCLNQTYKNIEVIVVDDHSTDNSLAIARQYEGDKVHVLINPNKGVGTVRNYAFEKSKGKFVKFLDSDDYISPGMVEKQMKRILDDGDEYTIAYSQLRNCFMPGEPEDTLNGLSKDYSPGIEYVVDMCRTTNHVWFSLLYLIPRVVVEKIGGWNPERTYYEDVEFIASAMNQSSNALFVDEEYAVWRIFDDNKHLHTVKSISVQKQKIEVLFYVTSLVLKHQDTPEKREMCSQYISYLIYSMFEEVELLYDFIDELFKTNQLTWFKYENPRMHLLYKILGWRKTTLFLKSLKGYLHNVF